MSSLPHSLLLPHHHFTASGCNSPPVHTQASGKRYLIGGVHKVLNFGIVLGLLVLPNQRQRKVPALGESKRRSQKDRMLLAHFSVPDLEHLSSSKSC